jgi:hypothetical protein
MSSDEQNTNISLLQSQLEDEERKYAEAVRNNREFWEIKQIQNNIKDIRRTLQTLQSRSTESDKSDAPQ